MNAFQLVIILIIFSPILKEIIEFITTVPSHQLVIWVSGGRRNNIPLLLAKIAGLADTKEKICYGRLNKGDQKT